MKQLKKMEAVTKYFKEFAGENVQVIAASLFFILVGQFGARFYEKVDSSEMKSAYSRGQFLRLVQYIFGVAPILYLLIGKPIFMAATSADESAGNHRFVYGIYALMGVLGIAICSMLLADVQKVKFTAEAGKTDNTLRNAKIFAIVGLIIYVLHVVLCLAMIGTANKDAPFSVASFKSASSGMMSKKSTSAAATTGFGMNDLLSFGKRRKRY